jgi:hypothetical protein
MRKNRDTLFLPLSQGNTARAGIHKSAPSIRSKVEYARHWIGTGSAKGAPREYPHTRMGVHKDRGNLKKGQELDRHRYIVSPNKLDTVYLNTK